MNALNALIVLCSSDLYFYLSIVLEQESEWVRAILHFEQPEEQREDDNQDS